MNRKASGGSKESKNLWGTHLEEQHVQQAIWVIYSNDGDCFLAMELHFFFNDDRAAMVNSLSVLGPYLILMSQDVHFKMHWGID